MIRSFGPSKISKIFMQECWISPAGDVIDVVDRKPVKAASKILVSLIGQNEYDKLKAKLKRNRIREDSYLCNKLGWVYVRTFDPEDVTLETIEDAIENVQQTDSSDELFWVTPDYELYSSAKIPDNKQLTFEQIETIHRFSNWEYSNYDSFFQFISGQHYQINETPQSLKEIARKLLCEKIRRKKKWEETH